MNNNLFVGGFPYEATEEDLSALFRACGTVKSVSILLERGTGRSRGLAFIEMSSETEARKAIAKFNGSTMGARKIFVSEARPREGRPGGFAAKPGFVERRSGKDRRRTQGASGGGSMSRDERLSAAASRRKGFFKPKKKWEGKPGSPGKKKNWSGKPRKFGGRFHGRSS